MGHWSAPVAAEVGRSAADARAGRWPGRAVAGTLADRWVWRCLALAAAYAAVACAVATRSGLSLRWPIADLLGRAAAAVLLTCAALALAHLVEERRGFRERTEVVYPRLLSVRLLAELAIAMLAVQLTLAAFANLEQLLPAVNDQLYDSPLWRLDERLHFGTPPAVLVSELAAALGLLASIDRAHPLFLAVQVAMPLLFLACPRLRPQRGRLLFAYCLLWVVGSAVYVLWPSLGPGYYRASRFAWLDQAPYAQALRETLIRDYARFRADPSNYGVELHGGVAALPSLDVAAIALFAIATRRRWLLSAALWALTAATFVGSLALAWHYAIDGYLGVLLAAGCWWLAQWLVAETPQTQGAPDAPARSGSSTGAAAR